MALTNVSDMKDLLAKILLRDKQQPEKLIIDLVTPQSDKLDNVITPPLSQQFANIKIGQIHANQVQVRTVFSEKHIIELAKSMELNGILQPIIVRIHPNQAYHGETTHYQIVAGERRWRAAKLTKLEKNSRGSAPHPSSGAVPQTPRWDPPLDTDPCGSQRCRAGPGAIT